MGKKKKRLFDPFLSLSLHLDVILTPSQKEEWITSLFVFHVLPQRKRVNSSNKKEIMKHGPTCPSLSFRRRWQWCLSMACPSECFRKEKPFVKKKKIMFLFLLNSDFLTHAPCSLQNSLWNIPSNVLNGKNLSKWKRKGGERKGNVSRFIFLYNVPRRKKKKLNFWSIVDYCIFSPCRVPSYFSFKFTFFFFLFLNLFYFWFQKK